MRSVILALKLVLMFGQEGQGSHIIKDDAVMLATLEASHPLGEDLS